MMAEALLEQRGNLLCWVPVCLGIGIGAYFSLRAEPTVAAWGVIGVGIMALIVLARLVPTAIAPLCLALALVGTGAGLAKYRTDNVAAPVLTFRYYGPIAGRVVYIDRSASDAIRLTLDRVALDVAPERTPTRIRISVHGAQPLQSYQPGDMLMMTGHLSPPSGPAEPGGFDFQRHAWFAGLGAVGYTRTPVLRSGPTDHGWDLWILKQRVAISQAVRATLPGETGAFAVAILTGDRASISQTTMQNLRDANLAHLLAISGLHMGLLTGVVFGLIRVIGAMIPTLALRLPMKKIAAVAAILTGAAYLMLSGGNVATERAFIMVSTMFVAVLLDRRALTLRAVAIAATIVLALRPEALAGPGFQMSFAATTALVAVFRAVRGMDKGLPKWARGPLSVVMSSAVAGLATAPFAAAHFNQISHFGLIANILSVPMMGVVIMPAAVLAVCLAPFGQAQVGLWIMDQGLRWILYVADTVANWDGAVGHVVAPHPQVLPLLAIGLLFGILWQGRARAMGGIAVVAAFGLWAQTDRPAVLIADTGHLIGVLGPEGRALSRDKGGSFVAGIWLENDGAPVDQATAAARPGLMQNGRIWAAEIGELGLLQVSGKTALAELQGCGGADIIVSNQTDIEQRPCLVFDVARLRGSGAVALYNEQDGIKIVTARDIVGVRPWNDAVRVGDPLPAFIPKRKNGPPPQPVLHMSQSDQ